VALKHHVGGTLLRADVGHISATDFNVAAGRGGEATDDAEEGCLAAPGWAEDGEEVAFVDLEVDRLDGADLAECLGHASQPEQDISAAVPTRMTGGSHECLLPEDHAPSVPSSATARSAPKSRTSRCPAGSKVNRLGNPRGSPAVCET